MSLAKIPKPEELMKIRYKPPATAWMKTPVDFRPGALELRCRRKESGGPGHAPIRGPGGHPTPIGSFRKTGDRSFLTA